MDKISTKDYMLYAIKRGLYKDAKWVIAVFGILPAVVDNREDLGIVRSKSTELKTLNMVNTIVIVDGVEMLFPTTLEMSTMIDKHERVQLKKGDLPFIIEDCESTYGILFMNALLILYPFDGKVTYQNRLIDGKFINNIAYKELGIDTVDAHKRYERACATLSAFAMVVVPSATEKSIVPDEKIFALRDKLLVEYKDVLDDPAKVAELQSKLVVEYKKYLKGDPSEDFFIRSKDMNMTRLRTMMMFGNEPDFYDENKINLITKSLSEGWEIEDIPMLANMTVGGSYARGKETALAGADVKDIIAILQTWEISEDDCGTTRGVKISINSDNYLSYAGLYIAGGESDKSLSIDDLKDMIGKSVSLRLPYWCETISTGCCKKCIGDQVVDSKVSLLGQAIVCISVFLSSFMKKVHTSELSIGRYNPSSRIT